ncbi:MAG: hypothetical protein L3J91_03240 [Thermoplasmata archaeon]|nr:hypothetical protein [Thermoplasmata archaeon]
MTAHPNIATPTPPSEGASDDPVVTILREHTELQQLAERFRQVADALDRGEASARADATEGVQVYRRFLISVHERREALFASEVSASAGAAVQGALARCAHEHGASEKFASLAEAELRASHLPAAGARRLAASFRAEAERVVEHHRSEAEQIYHPLRGKLSKEVLARVAAAMRPMIGEAAAAQTALTAWTSHANPAAD